MTLRHWLLLTGASILSAVLAFRLSSVVYAMIVLPLTYLLWLLKMLYLALPGFIWWSLLALAVVYILVTSLLPGIRFTGRTRLPLRPTRGGVENLSLWVKKSRRGTYFKWLVANRLGRIAHEILENRLAGKKRSFFDPLTGPDWTPAPGAQAYLEAGLQGSFADYPRGNPYFRQTKPTPLDHDVKAVIEYLETQAGDQQGGSQ